MAGSKVSYLVIGKWIQGINDHLYYVVTNTEPGEKRKQWWSSVANHICNIHNHNFAEFPACQHDPVKAIPCPDDESMDLIPAWLDKGIGCSFFFISRT